MCCSDLGHWYNLFWPFPHATHCSYFVDYKTDSIIQSSLRKELRGDVTLITIAHRLQTIMDADKIVSFQYMEA